MPRVSGVNRGCPFLAGCLAALVALPALGQVNQRAIDDVMAGKVKEAKASWWGFDPVESTRALQAAIDSGAPKVIVDNVGQPWVVGPIMLASNQEILLEKGVVVLAKAGAFHGSNDCLFRASLKENITLSGYGATLRMRRSDYAGPEYRKAEWRHCLSITSCTNVRVLGLTLAESGGDGVYLGTAKRGVTNKDIHIKDVTCDKNYRQGISVITAENLLIENCTLKDTAGTAPQAGIDFEPNHADERLVNCVMRNCTTRNNAGDGYDLYLPNLDADSQPVSIRLEHCRSIGDHGSGTRIVTGNPPQRALRGSIELVNCVFQRCGRAGIEVGNNPAGGCRVRFHGCSLLETTQGAPDQAPIVLIARPGASEPIGGIEFAGCVIRDAIDRDPMMFVDMSGVGASGISGTFIIEKNGRRQQLELTKELVAKWMPAASFKPIPRMRLKGLVFKPLEDKVSAGTEALKSFRLRGMGRCCVFAAEGQEVRFRIQHVQVAKYSGIPIPVRIHSPAGALVKETSVPFKEEIEMDFLAPETGLYRISADPGANYVQLVACSHAANLDGEDGPVHFYSSPGELYFWVPAGTKEFGVRVFGEGLGEAVKAALVDPAGEIVEEVDNVASAHQFEIRLGEPSPGQAWSLRMAKPSKLVMEDHHVDLRGIPPLLAPSPEALLVPAPRKGDGRLFQK